jgi:hypothetical protein
MSAEALGSAYFSRCPIDESIRQTEVRNMSGSRPGRYIVFATLTAVVVIGLAVVVFLASLTSYTGGEKFPKVYFLLAASILGSLVNQPFRDADDNRSKGPSLLILYLAWKCAIASVFAIVVNLIFISGVLSGELFPRFSGTNWPFLSMIHWALDVDPQTNADMAKMLIWSFVAGFSEKLVPNMVTKIFVIPE